jgi:hypothetical protein
LRQFGVGLCRVLVGGLAIKSRPERQLATERTQLSNMKDFFSEATIPDFPPNNFKFQLRIPKGCQIISFRHERLVNLWPILQIWEPLQFKMLNWTLERLFKKPKSAPDNERLVFVKDVVSTCTRRKLDKQFRCQNRPRYSRGKSFEFQKISFFQI